MDAPSLADRPTMSELKDRVFVFTAETFEAALEEWTRQQIAAYPHKEELIRITALAMRDFMGSEAAHRHKMALAPTGAVGGPHPRHQG
jgi:hypothetical protein